MILGIETATAICSAGLAEDDRVIAEISFDRKNLHDRVLAEAIQSLMRWNGVSPEQIHALAVSAGPGSFTGLRIGLGVAQGLALAQDKPIIALNTLLLQAAAAAGHARALAQGRGIDFSAVRLVPLLQARRGEVYTATYSARVPVPEQIEAEKVATLAELPASLSGFTLLCGNGVAAWRAAGLGVNHETVFALSAPEAPLSGGLVARLGSLKYRQNEFTNAGALEPFYVQEFVPGTTNK